MFTEQMTQALAIPANIDPQTQAQNATTTTGNGINMNLYKRVLFVLSVGTNNGSITVQPKASASSGGSFAQINSNVTNALTTSNKQVTVEVRADQMPSGKPWLRFDVIEGNVGNCVVSAIVLADESPNKPANANNQAAVSQQLIAA